MSFARHRAANAPHLGGGGRLWRRTADAATGVGAAGVALAAVLVFALAAQNALARGAYASGEFTRTDSGTKTDSKVGGLDANNQNVLGSRNNAEAACRTARDALPAGQTTTSACDYKSEFVNQCAALATGTKTGDDQTSTLTHILRYTFLGTSGANGTGAEARTAALAACTNDGFSNCTVDTTRCDADCFGFNIPKGGDEAGCRGRLQSDCSGNTPILRDVQCQAAENDAQCSAVDPSWVLGPGGTCRERVEADCTGATSIFLPATKTCRGFTQEECDATPTTRILDNGVCRGATQEECDAVPTTPILQNGACRAALNQQDCTNKDEGLVFVSGGSCRDRNAGDCVAPTPIFNTTNKTCRSATQAECTATPATPVLDASLGACRETQPRDCTRTQIFENNACRDREQRDCDGTTTPILDNGVCRSVRQADCTGTTPILEFGRCREIRATDCGGGTPILDGTSCRGAIQSDCDNTRTPILDGTRCRVARQADCTGTAKPILDGTICREARQSDCTGTTTPIFEGGACRAAVQTDCDGTTTPILEGTVCRERQAIDCSAPTGVFVSTTKTCRAAVQADCTGATPVLENGACRTRNAADSFGAYYSYERQVITGGSTLRFVSGAFAVNQPTPADAAAVAAAACQDRFNNAAGTIIQECEAAIPGGFNNMCINTARESGFVIRYFGLGATPAAAIANRESKRPGATFGGATVEAGCDCGGATPIIDGSTCRAAANQAECDAIDSSLVFVAGGTCRAPLPADCTGNKPIFDSGTCRAATRAECALMTATPILDGGACRAAVEADCGGTTPIFDSGTCRARNSGDNYGAYYHFTRFGGINNGGLSFNHPTQAAANEAAKAACEQRRRDFGGGTSACNPHPRVPNGFTECIETAETGPVRYVGLGATPEAARLDRQSQPGSGNAGFNNNNPQAACNCGDGKSVDGNSCKTTTAADCTGNTIFDGGNCRPRVATDCTGLTPVLDASGACRERRETDCAEAAPILDGGTCRAARDNLECLAKSTALRFDAGGTCRAVTQADCTGTAAPILDANSGACRERIASDCSGATPDLMGGVCVAACPAGTPVRDATSGNCRVAQQADCDATPGTPILDGVACRAATQADCTGTTTPILDGVACRARNAADCTTAAAPVLDSTSGNCRAATTAAECPFGLSVLDGGVCRAATQADCTNDAPVLDAGGCRAARAGDTFGAYYTYTAGSQLVNGRFVVNQPTPEAAATEARRACEAVRAGSIGGLFGDPSACAPDASAPNGFNGVCINTGEVGPRRFVGYGATPAEALAARAAQSGNRNVNFPIAACDCSASQIRAGNDCQPRTSAATCSGDTPVLDRGFCREVRAEDCGGNTPIFDGGVCRGAVAAECTGRTPILDGGACRAAVSVEDCAGVNALFLPAGDGSCRTKRASDCGGLTPIFDGGLCRARQARDCAAPTPFLDPATNQCREAVAADCVGDMPIFENNACRPAAQADCDATPATPDLVNGRCYAACPSGLPVRDGTTRLCRIAEARDCTGGTPVFENGNCREQRQDECVGNTPILDGGACRGAATDADCGTLNPLLVMVSDGSCRLRVASDCTGATPIFNGAICRAALTQAECDTRSGSGTPLLFDGGACRLRTQADCTDVQVLDGGVCRAIEARDCTDGTPIFEDNKCRAAANQDDCTAKARSLLYIGEGQCRTRVAADCSGDKPFLDATSGECRAISSADCPIAQPILNEVLGVCRVADNQAECTAKDTILQFDGGTCRPRVASDCAATEAFENGFCRTRTSQDCTGATPRFDGGRCFPNSAFATFGAYFDYEAGTGSDRYTTGFIDPLIVNRPTAAQARADALAACQAASASAAANGETITRACAEAATGGFTGCINVATDLSDFSDYFGLGDTPAAARAAREAKHTGNTGTQIAACNCGGATPIADSTSPTLCRAAQTPAECPMAIPIFDGGACRLATNQAECTSKGGNLVFDGGSCRPRVAGDCTGDTPIFDGGYCFPETSFLHGSYFEFEGTSQGATNPSRIGNFVRNYRHRRKREPPRSPIAPPVPPPPPPPAFRYLALAPRPQHLDDALILKR